MELYRAQYRNKVSNNSTLPSSHSSDVPLESDGVAAFDVELSEEAMLGVEARTKCKESLRTLTKLLSVLVGSFAWGGG